MNSAVINLKGRYYDGIHPQAQDATLAFEGDALTLITPTETKSFKHEELRVSPEVGASDRFVGVPGGGQFQCENHSLLSRLTQEVPSEGPVSWLEARPMVAFVSVVLIVLTVALGYNFGLPLAAKHVAEKIPIEAEQTIGEQSLSWLEDNGMFEPSELDTGLTASLQSQFAELHAGLPISEQLRLEFRQAPALGPNAFALPGGTIVVTDELIALAETEAEVLAVLAHEIGHVELRHIMRNILQTSVVGVAAAVLTGDAATSGVAVAGLPALLVQSAYSREFESAADDYAFKLLTERGLSPGAFADIMDRISKEHGGSVLPSYVSSHPLTEERTQKARAVEQEQ